MAEQTDDRVRDIDVTLAPEDADRKVMVCPVCGYENLQGDDQCANCGADLRTSDIPVASTTFERLLVDVPLKAIQTRQPFTVRDDAPVAEVLEQMRREQTADVLVVRGDRLVGIFTERDALMKLAGSGSAVAAADLANTPVSDVMTHDPVVLRASDSVAVAVQKMAVGGFRHIPLVADGRPIGVVSATDIFRHILRLA
ncbi:MAG: CBS domain-containing protein [Candidatus Limnocylindrales bacterium]